MTHLESTSGIHSRYKIHLEGTREREGPTGILSPAEVGISQHCSLLNQRWDFHCSESEAGEVSDEIKEPKELPV